MDDSAAGPAPRLAPHAVLLRRGPGELQIGIEPSVVVPDAYGPLVRALAAGAPPARLDHLAHQHGLPPRAVPDLVDALAGAGLLRPGTAAATTTVRVVGVGPLGTRTAYELVAAGFGTVYLADLPRHPPDDDRTRPAPTRRPSRKPAPPDRVDLLVGTLGGARPGTRVLRTRHFVKPEGDAVALTVVVADGPEPDRLVPDVLREHAAPHLLVRCSGDEASVGPLVVPGETSCVRCTDLARRDADPRWPWLLEQLTRLEITPAPTLLAWAAVTAAVQALAFVGGGGPETLGHTLELDVDRPTMRLRAWASHPECPCRWVDTGVAVPDRGRGVGAGDQNGRHA